MSTPLYEVQRPIVTCKANPSQKLPNFLTVQECADLLRCKKRTIYDMVEQRRIPFRKVGGRVLFDLDEIIDWTKKG
jgi:excisionase family DNA binding protein